MLACEEVYRDSSDAIDGELPGWRRLQIRLHLSMCERCRDMMGSLERTVALLRRMRPR